MSSRTLIKNKEHREQVFQISFELLGHKGSFPAGQPLLQSARQLGIDLISICGGLGKCGQCKVKIEKRRTTVPTDAESRALDEKALRRGYRLACQTYAVSDLVVYVPPESLSSSQRVQVEGTNISIRPEPAVRTYEVFLSAPSLSDLRADDERVYEALKQQGIDCRSIDTDLLAELSIRLRSLNWHAGAILWDSELISLKGWPSRQLGLAIDLGTTKVAGYLIDLESGNILASKGIMSPQATCGEDVITRINFALKGSKNANRLQGLAVAAINQLAVDLSSQIDAEPRDIVDAVVVGNTAMHHLLLGLPSGQLARAPHVPAAQHALDIKAREVGVKISPGSYLHLFPNVAGFVGGDHIAMLLSTGAHKGQGAVLALDIGTNTEICLVSQGELTSVSCASGPAFEGGHIKFGMRAAAGAIDHLRISGESIQYHTVEGKAPVGICGSGILEAVAQLLKAGVLDRTGRMMDGHPNVHINEKEREFVLVNEAERDRGPAITITQKDIRQLQLAKGAIRAGIQVLLKKEGLQEDAISQVILAGAFGTYLDIPSAVSIGMLPELPLERFRQVGNAAGSGASMGVISQTARTEAQWIARQIRYIELAAVQNFNKIFLQSIHM